MEINRTSFQFKDLIEKSKKILIILGSEPSVDVVSAGIALNYGLKSVGKKVHLVATSNLPDNTSVLAGVEEIKKDLESKNLVISLDYEKNPIDKISYKMEGKTFNLIVKPRKNINIEEDYNLIIILGTKNLKELETYLKHRDLFESVPTINIDIDESNFRYGKLNIIDTEIKSVSALVSLLLNDAKIKLPEKSANMLLLGIREATQNFTKVEGSKIFEAAAYTSRSKEEEEESTERPDEEVVSTNLPKDWLSPKVYRSSKVS